MKSCLANCKAGDVLVCKSGRSYLVTGTIPILGRVRTILYPSGTIPGFFDESHANVISKIIKAKNEVLSSQV